jgi:hypothetical protein
MPKIKLKYKLFAVVALVVVVGLVMLFQFPRALSILFSYRKTCRVLRVEQFMKGMVVTNPMLANKFSVVCEDGSICRAEDSGFAGVKAGDEIEYRGFPEFSSIEEFGKCDHAQLIRLKPANVPNHPVGAGPSGVPVPTSPPAGAH